MNIASLYWGICSSASLFQGDAVIAATHEERFSRSKNDEAFPCQALRCVLSEAGLCASDLDGVAISGFRQPFDDTLVRKHGWTVDDYLRE